MTIERTSQGIRISAMRDGYRVSKHYIFYTRKEAIAEFKAEYLTGKGI